MKNTLLPEPKFTALLEKIANSGGEDHHAFSELAEASCQVEPKHISAWEKYLRWETLSIKYRRKPKKWQFWRKQPAFPEWVNIASVDGYERESGIQAITTGAPSAIFFALLIRRLNDWVPQVRAAAGKKVVVVARASESDIIANALCAVLPRWTSWGRWKEQEKLRLMEVVELDHVSRALCEKLISNTSGPMSQVLSQVGRSDAIDENLPDIAVKSIQPAVRARSYRMLLERKSVWVEGRAWKWTDIRYSEGKYVPVLGERKIHLAVPLIATIEQALSDSSPAVRRVGAEKFIQHLDEFGERAVHISAKIASDRSSSVAERGRFAQRRLRKLNSSQ